MRNEDLSGIFKRNVPGSTEILQEACVGIAGCGGLGSNAAAALVRAGIGKLILADFDRVELSNLNRQYYFLSDLGKSKVEALEARLKDINPEVDIDACDIEVTPEEVDDIFSGADLLIEAFDRAESKHWLIERWCLKFPDRHLVCASGISGLGGSSSISIRSSGKIHFVGDEKTGSDIGLCSARVGLAANMQANLAIELLTGQEGWAYDNSQ
ncbi:MAG: sulfur carrier protein ThiS adenylyltransferase ThiF [Candidatus Krumholzibacteriota bacterium]|nr:sulfur carrier protein ThiS adenylyltransferase ThiF [Candidatus Krumholzibacteriota bacterium]